MDKTRIKKMAFELFKKDFIGKKFSEHMVFDSENPSDIISNNTAIDNYGILYEMYLELAARLEETEERILNPKPSTIEDVKQHLMKQYRLVPLK